MIELYQKNSDLSDKPYFSQKSDIHKNRNFTEIGFSQIAILILILFDDQKNPKLNIPGC